MQLDFWTIFGFLGQGIYFLRFLIQWIYSEKSKASVVPDIFWPISIVGAIFLFVYAVARMDIVFIVGSVLSLFIYVRNYYFTIRSKKVATERQS
tara:strand:+ start:11126 stop:11407 length:282 start_codon:yes stop_codon:yes gene_type:complete